MVAREPDRRLGVPSTTEALDMGMTGAASPIQPTERVLILDIVRGFALFGVLWMNLFWFAGTAVSLSLGEEELTRWNEAVRMVTNMFLSGRFNAMFCVLFGIGFTLQLERLARREPDRMVTIYARRLAVLLAFGVLHFVLLWPGDILHIYAVLGFVLLPLRRVPDRLIAGLIAICLVFYPVARLVVGLADIGVVPGGEVREALAGTADAAWGGGSYLETIPENVRWQVSWYVDLSRLQLRLYLSALVTMLLGILAGRQRWLQRANEHPSIMRRVQWWSLGIGALGVALNFGLLPLVDAPRQLEIFVGNQTYEPSRIGFMVFYVVTLVRLSSDDRRRRWLMPLAAVGRMPLTNYVMQSLMCTFVFYGWGLGYWRVLTPTTEVVFALVLFVGVQVPLSVWWSRHYSYGPLEYVWRVLTYGARPKMAPATPELRA